MRVCHVGLAWALPDRSDRWGPIVVAVEETGTKVVGQTSCYFLEIPAIADVQAGRPSFPCPTMVRHSALVMDHFDSRWITSTNSLESNFPAVSEICLRVFSGRRACSGHLRYSRRSWVPSFDGTGLFANDCNRSMSVCARLCFHFCCFPPPFRNFGVDLFLLLCCRLRSCVR